MKADGRTYSHQTLEAYRFVAIKLFQQKVEVKVIANSFGVTPQVVYQWIRRHSSQGISGLKSQKALGPEPRLAQKQFARLLKLLRKPATESGYSTDLWSGPRLRHLLKKRFKVIYHAKHMPRFLRRLGLMLKKPERRALEQDPVEVRKWKAERLPEILRYAKRRKALIFYADESLISLIPYVGKTWTFPKVRPVVRVSGKRGQHIGVTAAVNEQGRLCFEITREGERFTAKTFLRFIKKMRREHPSRRIVLIVDGAPIHKANIVKLFEKLNSSWFRKEILPAYSPEFNPTEKCWVIRKDEENECSGTER